MYGDFGNACELECPPSTQESALWGGPDAVYTEKTDVYALGALSYWLMLGVLPWRDRDAWCGVEDRKFRAFD